MTTQEKLNEMGNKIDKPRKTALRKAAVMPSVCAHPITYATYAKFCPRKCLLCGEFVK